MLFAISLAQKLGIKHNLQAFSLHPGVIWTNLGNHLDWSVDLDGLSKKIFNPFLPPRTNTPDPPIDIRSSKLTNFC